MIRWACKVLSWDWRFNTRARYLLSTVTTLGAASLLVLDKTKAVAAHTNICLTSPGNACQASLSHNLTGVKLNSGLPTWASRRALPSITRSPSSDLRSCESRSSSSASSLSWDAMRSTLPILCCRPDLTKALWDLLMGVSMIILSQCELVLPTFQCPESDSKLSSCRSALIWPTAETESSGSWVSTWSRVASGWSLQDNIPCLCSKRITSTWYGLEFTFHPWTIALLYGSLTMWTCRFLCCWGLKGWGPVRRWFPWGCCGCQPFTAPCPLCPWHLLFWPWGPRGALDCLDERFQLFWQLNQVGSLGAWGWCGWYVILICVGYSSVVWQFMRSNLRQLDLHFWSMSSSNLYKRYGLCTRFYLLVMLFLVKMRSFVSTTWRQMNKIWDSLVD